MNDKNSRNYNIHSIYALVIFLSVVLVLSYMVWNKIQTQNEIKIKEEQAAKMQEIRQLKIQKCIALSLQYDVSSWASTCFAVAKATETKINNCIDYWDGLRVNSHKQSIATCKNIYGTPDPSPNCLLPPNMANALNKAETVEQGNCQNIN